MAWYSPPHSSSTCSVRSSMSSKATNPRVIQGSVNCSWFKARVRNSNVCPAAPSRLSMSSEYAGREKNWLEKLPSGC